MLKNQDVKFRRGNYGKIALVVLIMSKITKSVFSGKVKIGRQLPFYCSHCLFFPFPRYLRICLNSTDIIKWETKGEIKQMCHFNLALLEFPNPSDFVSLLFCRQPQWIRSQPASWDWINLSYVFFFFLKSIEWIREGEKSNQNACSVLHIWPSAKFIWGHP